MNAKQRRRQARSDSNEIIRRADNWTNNATGVGVAGKDKRLAATVSYAPVFGARGELDDLYHGNDIAKRICRLPAETMLRNWIDIKIGDDNDLPKALEQKLQELGAQSKLIEAKALARCMGGACVLLGVDDGLSLDDPNALSRPLNFEGIKSVSYLTVFDRFELTIETRVTDPLAPDFGEPALYRLNPAGAQGRRTGRLVHASRMIRFDGVPTTRYRRVTHNNSWHDSIFVSIYNVLRRHSSMWDSSEALTHDFAQAVIKIKDLADLLATKGVTAVKERIEVMDYARSVLRAIVLDGEHEDFDRKPTPLTGLPELLTLSKESVASAAEMPMTLLFGTSPGGLNATGESDIRNWYDTVKAKQQAEVGTQLEYLLRVLLCSQDGPTGGKEPEEWSYEFRPLWQMSDKEKAELRKIQAETDRIYLQEVVVSANEIAQSRFGGDGYSLETVLQEGDRATLADAAEAEAAAQEAQLAQAKAANSDTEKKPGKEGAA
jgi:phage-related protein (TIGR01555 family)